MQLNLRQRQPRAFYGWDGLGDVASDAAIVGVDLSSDPIIPVDPSTIYADPGSTIVPTSTTVVDTSGISWGCDAYGNCCNAAGDCQVGAPSTTDTASASAVNARAAAAAAAGISPSAINAAAQIAAAIAKAINPAAGTTVCPTGYIYGAPGVPVQLAPGVVTTGTGKCLPVTSPSILPGVSNSSLVVIGIALFAFVMVSSGGRRR